MENNKIKGVVYAILDDEYFYIGSTTKPIEERMYNHKMASTQKSYKYSKLYNYINEVRGNWDNIIYIILENVECNTLRELENKEYSYLKPHLNDPYCLNVIKNINQKHIIYNYKKKIHK
jgi:hypothetical protein